MSEITKLPVDYTNGNREVRHGNDDVFVINAEIYRPQLVLADETRNLQFPTLSSDGKQFVYQAEMPDKRGELRLFDFESKQNQVLIKTENADIAPAFAADGECVAFQNRINGNSEIFLIKPDGTDLTNLTNNPARDFSPSRLPDRKQIVFVSDTDGNWEIYFMRHGGTGLLRLARNVRRMSRRNFPKTAKE